MFRLLFYGLMLSLIGHLSEATGERSVGNIGKLATDLNPCFAQVYKFN